MHALVLALLVLVAAPAAAGAATVGVEPYVEPPDTDPFGSCHRFMTCPRDMLVFTAAAGEANQVAITQESTGGPTRYRVHDGWAPVQAGAGCAQVDLQTATCTAGIVGPVRLGDSNDWIVARQAAVSGGDGEDVLSVAIGHMEGDAGDDLLIGDRGDGGGGDDVLMVTSGTGASGSDTMRCPSQSSGCYFLDGGPGNDVLTGAGGPDRLFGRRGRDLLYGRAGEDALSGGLDNDRLAGGEGPDDVNCGAGRRDRAVTDRRDRVSRCERVARAPAAAAAP